MERLLKCLEAGANLEKGGPGNKQSEEATYFLFILLKTWQKDQEWPRDTGTSQYSMTKPQQSLHGGHMTFYLLVLNTPGVGQC